MEVETCLPSFRRLGPGVGLELGAGEAGAASDPFLCGGVAVSPSVLVLGPWGRTPPGPVPLRWRLGVHLEGYIVTSTH